MPWPQTGATHYYTQLGRPDKGLPIKWLVVFYIVWIKSMKGIGHKTSARCEGLVPSYGQDTEERELLGFILIINLYYEIL